MTTPPTTDGLPAYDDLPVRPELPPGSSWGLWGDGDTLGCLNLLTPQRVAAGVAAIRDHRSFALDLPLGLPDPPLFGRRRLSHTVTDHQFGHDDVFDGLNPQSSSQWDGFRHVRHPAVGFYGGVADAGHGVQHWARKGIVGRGVLVDVAGWRAATGRPVAADRPDPITAADLEAAIVAQGTVVETGDLLLVRTGWMQWYHGLDAAARVRLANADKLAMASCGLSAGRPMARLLWNLHIAAIAADNPALEVWPIGSPHTRDEVARLRQDPDRCEEVFLHYALIPKLGLPIGELWDLEELAAACAADRRYEFLLVSAPIGVAGAASSPANTVAIR